MDRKEPRAGKFTLDKESPIQGQEPQAPGLSAGAGSVLGVLIKATSPFELTSACPPRADILGSPLWAITESRVVPPLESRLAPVRGPALLLERSSQACNRLRQGSC